MLGLTVSGAMALHQHAIGLPLVFVSLALVVLFVFFWWRDVIREGVKEKAHTKQVARGLRLGMALFICSEVMFFVAFFWAFFGASLYPILPLEDVWAIAKGVWPPEGIQTFNAWDLPFMNTLILLLSGTTVTWAHHALLQNKRAEVIKALWLTVLLGLSFTSLQAYEYAHAAFGMADTIYGTTFYLATGFHGLHVLIGTIFLAVMLRRAYTGTLESGQHLGFEFAAWYWHFVDVVWLFLFVSIYWWGS
jgi:cytochrome c oxidase subunit 3